MLSLLFCARLTKCQSITWGWSNKSLSNHSLKTQTFRRPNFFPRCRIGWKATNTSNVKTFWQSPHWHFTGRHYAQGQQDLIHRSNMLNCANLLTVSVVMKRWGIYNTLAIFWENIKSDGAERKSELPLRVAVERWLWSCWWVMSIWISGWGRWGIGDCCWAGCGGQLKSRCELCPSAPSAETPVPKKRLHTDEFWIPPSLRLSTWNMYLKQ